MTTSKHLITALEKSDWLDRMLVFAGLAFFVLVVAFILKQRIVDRGLRIAFWWTRFIPDFSGDEALLAMEVGEASLSATASSVASVVSTALVTASTAATSLASSVSSTDGGSLASHSASDTTSNLPTSPISESPLPAAESTDIIPSTAEEPTETPSSQHDEL